MSPNPSVGVSNEISAGDLFWWRVDEPTNPMVINVLLGVEGTITLAELRDYLKPHVVDNLRLQAIPTPARIGSWRPYFLGSIFAAFLVALLFRCCFSYVLAVGLLLGFILESYFGCQWYWAKVKDFALEDYIKLHMLESDTLECLHQFIEEEASKQLPRDRAQWMVFLIHNAPGGTKMLFRFHHVIADGAGLGMWFYKLCSTEEQQKADEDERRAQIAKWKEQKGKNRKHGLALLKDMLLQVVVNIHGAWKLLTLSRDSNSPFKGPKIGRKKTALRPPVFTVEEVKKVGKSVDPSITVNDTISALLAGAFVRYFKSLSLHPEQMLLRTTLAVNGRRPTATIKMENVFTVVFKSLPLHLSTPEERIAHFHVRMGILKRGIEPLLSLFLEHILPWMPEPLMKAALHHLTICASAVTTNVVSSQTAFSMCGQVVTGADFWVPSSGDIGVGISVLTYCDKIMFNMVSDAGLISDWDPFLKCISEEWEEMKKLLTNGEKKVPVKLPEGPVEFIQLPQTWGLPGERR